VKEYKVWISIEEIDEENDSWENIGEPDSLGTFDTLEQAQEYLSDVYGAVSRDDLSKARNRRER